MKKNKVLINFFGLVAIIILINIISTFFVKRLDLTEDKRYSLSPNTIELLKSDDLLKERVFFKVYLDGDLPAGLKNVRNSIEYILEEFVAAAGDKVQYEFIDPNESDDEDYVEEMRSMLYNEGNGILPTQLQKVDKKSAEVKWIWPGAIVEYGGQTSDVIQFFDRRTIIADQDIRGLVDQTINDLEFKFISSIRRVTQTNRKKIGFLQGQDELDKKYTWDIRRELEKDYIIGDVEINNQLNAFDEIDALIIAQPKKAFTEKEKFIIDQFVMNGGKILWFLDPLDINVDSLNTAFETFAIDRRLNVEQDLLYKYGVRVNKNLVFDDQATFELLPPRHLDYPVKWGFYPLISSGKHIITKNLDPIHMRYASSLELVNEADTSVKKTVLLKSSTQSKALMAPVRVNVNFIPDVPNGYPDLSNPQFGNNPVAVLLEGTFKSPFENRISDAFLNSESFQTKFKSVPNKMIVVSDGDVINSSAMTYDFKKNKGVEVPVPLDYDKFHLTTANGSPMFQFGNKEFILNAIDYLLDDHALLAIRSKTITLRMLNQEKIETERQFWNTLNILLPLLIIALFALIQLLIRRKKYTSKL